MHEERAIDERLELEMVEQAQRARKFVEAQLLESDFSWMRDTRDSGARNPRTTRTSCYYDFTRMHVGSHDGAPLWVEGRGRWLGVKQGSAKVAALKGESSTFLVLRVPFRKSGGGQYCNTYTITTMMKLNHICARGVLSTGGWDEWSKLNDGDDQAQLCLNDAGVLGAHGTFTSDGGNSAGHGLTKNTWVAVSIAVDAIGGVVRTYVDGEESTVVRSNKICKDGQWAIRGRMALFYYNLHCMDDTCYYLRQLTVHNRVLEASQIANEHAMLHSLLIDDVFASVPAQLRPALTAMSIDTPLTTPGAVRARLGELRDTATRKAEELWRTLLLVPAKSTSELDALLDAMAPHDIAVAAHWHWKEAGVEEVMGDTLLHCAAHVGFEPLIDALLAAGAHVNGCSTMPGTGTALHTAASRGCIRICRRLLDAGADATTTTVATKRCPLYLACANGHAETARLLVTAGGADPYRSMDGSESAMALLRRLATQDALSLLSVLDTLCGSKPLTDAPPTEAESKCKDDGSGMLDDDVSDDDEGNFVDDDEYEYEDEDGET